VLSWCGSLRGKKDKLTHTHPLAATYPSEIEMSIKNLKKKNIFIKIRNSHSFRSTFKQIEYFLVTFSVANSKAPAVRRMRKSKLTAGAWGLIYIFFCVCEAR
jgi:hypothetical protein